MGVWMYIRGTQRRGWRWGLLVAIVVAMSVAAIVATVSAASRSEHAFTDLRAATHASDITVTPDEADAEVNEVRRSVASIRGVTRTSVSTEVFVRPAGRDDLFPDFNLFAGAPGRFGRGGPVNVPLIVQGRAPGSARVHEVAVSEHLASDLDVSVGDVLRLESMTDAWVDVAFNGGDPGPPDGPAIRARVVGIARSPADFGRWQGLLHFSPAFVERYADQIRTYGWVDAQLRSGSTAQRAADERRVARALDGFEAGPSDVFGDPQAVTDGLGTIATTLRITALVAAIAGLAVVGLVLARSTRAALQDRPTLVALGWTTRELMLAGLLGFGPWLGLGVAIGLAAGVVAAPHALVGLAAQVDPALGAAHVDIIVVLCTGAFSIAIGVAVIVVTARRTGTTETRRSRPPLRVVPLDRPVPMALGVRAALAGERASGGRASRVAVVAMSVGIAGAIAAFTVSASIGRLQGDPNLTGQGGGRLLDSGETLDKFDAALPVLRHNKRISELATLHVSFGVKIDGQETATLIVDQLRGDPGASVISGRLPDGAREAAVGPATLAELGKDVGDAVRLAGDEGSRRYRVVGSVLFPEGDFAFDQGLLLNSAGAAPLVGDVPATSALHQIAFDWRPGVDVKASERELRQMGFRVLTNQNSLQPARVTNLGQVETLPRYLAAFLAVLALVTLGHALAVTTRRRRRESATLRVLGLTPRAGAGVVGAQALVILAIAVFIGVPLGMVVGARIWESIAERAHVVVLVVTPAGAIVGFLACVVTASAILAGIPAWKTAHLRVAAQLRDE